MTGTALAALYSSAACGGASKPALESPTSSPSIEQSSTTPTASASPTATSAAPSLENKIDSFITIPQNRNVLKNPRFAAGVEGWKEITEHPQGTYVWSPTGGLLLNSVKSGQNPHVYQVLKGAISPGDTITLEYYVTPGERGRVDQYNNGCGVGFDLYDPSQPGLIGTFNGPRITEEGYGQTTFTIPEFNSTSYTRAPGATFTTVNSAGIPIKSQTSQGVEWGRPTSSDQNPNAPNLAAFYAKNPYPAKMDIAFWADLFGRDTVKSCRFEWVFADISKPK